MLKNICKLELTVGGRVYQFLCDNDSPIPDLKECLFQFQKYIGSIEDQVKAQQEQPKEVIEEPKVELNKVEELPQG